MNVYEHLMKTVASGLAPMGASYRVARTAGQLPFKKVWLCFTKKYKKGTN
jgi:hypothetical protein